MKSAQKLLGIGRAVHFEKTRSNKIDLGILPITNASIQTENFTIDNTDISDPGNSSHEPDLRSKTPAVLNSLAEDLSMIEDAIEEPDDDDASVDAESGANTIPVPATMVIRSSVGIFKPNLRFALNFQTTFSPIVRPLSVGLVLMLAVTNG